MRTDPFLQMETGWWPTVTWEEGLPSFFGKVLVVLRQPIKKPDKQNDKENETFGELCLGKTIGGSP